MDILLAGLAALIAVAFVVPLAVLRAGIWQQEHAASLACRPHSRSAALTRRVCGLYAHLSEPAAHRAARPGHADGEPPLAARRNGSALS
jgi:hypothetical protein